MDIGCEENFPEIIELSGLQEPMNHGLTEALPLESVNGYIDFFLRQTSCVFCHAFLS